MNSLIQSYKEKLRISGVEVERFIGCDEEDITILKLCQCIGYLPPVYIEFMKNFGRNTNSVARHEWELGYGIALFLKQFAIDTYEASPDYKITVPDDAFVFAKIVQDDNFYYFLTIDCNENPPVYQLFTNQGEAKQAYSSLSVFYDTFVESISRRHI